MAYVLGPPDNLRPDFAVVLVRDQRDPNKVLAVSRRGSPQDLGLPGGKVEPGETPEHAARRELMEETGLYAVILEYIFDRYEVTADPDKIARVYEATLTLGKPRTLEEGCEVSWVDKRRLLEPQCSFRDYNRQLFEYLEMRDEVV